MKKFLKKIKFIRLIYKIIRSIIFFREKSTDYPWIFYLFFDNKFKFYKRTISKKHNLNIIDVGGFKGYWSLFFLRNFQIKNINIFEPASMNLGSINRRLGEKKNVTIHNMGLSDKIEERMFYEYSQRDINSVYKNLPNNAILVDQYLINLNTLDNVLNTNEIYDVLKIDVEGHECNVLMGAQKILSNVKVLEIECHKYNIFENKNQSSLDKITALLPTSFVLSFQETFNKGSKDEFSDLIFINLNF